MPKGRICSRIFDGEQRSTKAAFLAFLSCAVNYAMFSPVLSPFILDLIYPPQSIPVNSREKFNENLPGENEKEIRGSPTHDSLRRSFRAAKS
jgi:hypothetical protein